MAKTNAESIRELEQGLATLSERVENLRERVEALEKELEEADRRRWQLTLAFVGAILSLAVGLVLALVRK